MPKPKDVTGEIGSAVLNQFEEARAHIRELEREVERLALVVSDNAKAMTNLKRDRETFQEKYAQEAIANNRLKTALANVDGTADRQRADAIQARNNGLTKENADLRRRISYLEGWIDSRQGKEPLINPEIGFDPAVPGKDMAAIFMRHPRP